MNELLKAAKAVIDRWDLSKMYVESPIMDELRAAVERAEKQERVGFGEWFEYQDKYLTAEETWIAAAPEMLDMLKECRATLASVFVYGVPEGMVDRINALIQKTEGTMPLMNDVARCHGEKPAQINDYGVCTRRNHCVRYVERHTGGERTPNFAYLCINDESSYIPVSNNGKTTENL